MSSYSDANQAEKQPAEPRRHWVRLVIGVQCLVVVALAAVLIPISGVLDRGRNGGNSESEVTSTDEPDSLQQEEVEVAASMPTAPIAESSLAAHNDAEPRTEKTTEPQSSKAPKPKNEPDSKNELEPSPSAQTQKSSPPKNKPARPKPENPLEHLPKAADILKSLQSHGDTVLGPLNMPPGLRLDIEMHGGDTAHRVKVREQDEPGDDNRRSEFVQANKGNDRIEYDGVPTFRFRETFDDAGNVFWTIDLTDYRGTIAKIWTAEGKLRFEWTENSGRYEESGYLANCVLLISVPDLGRAHAMALRKPIRAQAAPIDFVRGTATTEYPVPFMPPDETLTVEAAGATKPLPKPSLGMDRWLTTDRDFTYLKFGDGAPLVVKVLASTKYADGQPRIVTATYFNLPRVAEHASGTQSQLGSLRTRTERAIKLLNGQKSELAKLRPQGAQQRSALSKARREIDRDIRGYQTQMRQIKWLEGVVKKSQKPPGVVFRIIHSAGDYTVDLAHGGF